MDVEAWLGEYYTDSDGSEVALPDAVKVVLAKAFKDGVLDVKQDILDDAVELRLPPKRMKQLVEIFQIAYKDVVPQADQKLMHLARIACWLRARYSEDGDEASSIMDGKAKDKPSEAEGKDLEAQGLATPRQMRILELSLYLGRPVGDAELEGGSYKSPAATFKGSTLAKKGGGKRAQLSFIPHVNAGDKHGSTAQAASRLGLNPMAPAPPPMTTDELGCCQTFLIRRTEGMTRMKMTG